MDGGEVVAIKVMGQAMQRDAEAVQRFEHEVRHATRLRHQGIVRVFEGGSDNGVPYLVMELLEGNLLSERTGLSEAEAWGLLRPVFDAVSYAHAEGVLHRDLNPRNVMVTPHGVKVLDFGLARGPRDTTLPAPERRSAPSPTSLPNRPPGRRSPQPPINMRWPSCCSSRRRRTPLRRAHRLQPRVLDASPHRRAEAAARSPRRRLRSPGCHLRPHAGARRCRPFCFGPGRTGRH